MAKPKQAPNNPFACASNAVKMHTVGPCCGTLLAVYSYEVQDAGGTMVLTPLTGNTSTDLKYYRWSIVDKNGKAEGGALDLNAPSAAVTVNTSQLDASGPFKVKFAACEQNGTEEKSVSYDIVINDLASNPTGDSTPKTYENVTMLLKLTSTDDAEFIGFPVDGLEISDGQVIDLNAYLVGATQLDNLGSYVFSLEVKKCWYSPSAEQPAPTGVTVIASSTPEAGYPIALGVDYVQLLSGITIATGSAGQFSDVVTTALNNEGVQPSFSFTLKTDVA